MTELRIPPRGEETIFTWGAPPLKFGAGASDEIGFELSQYDVCTVCWCSPIRGSWPAGYRTVSPTHSPITA